MSLDGIAALKFLLSGDAAHCSAVLKSHCSFYSTFLNTLKKRRELKAQIEHYSISAIYNRSIVIDYFIRGKKRFSDLPVKSFL
jgi:hypothetical protein